MKPIDYNRFLETLHNEMPEREWPNGLQALWYDAKGDWEASHDIAQEMYNKLGSWIHAYLHRKEGDQYNAGYWYRKANRPFPQVPLEAELQQLVEYILEK